MPVALAISTQPEPLLSHRRHTPGAGAVAVVQPAPHPAAPLDDGGGPAVQRALEVEAGVAGAGRGGARQHRHDFGTGRHFPQGDGAPRINQVASDSVAEVTGLKAGDHVVRAAGVETRNPDDVVEIIGRQAPGTWLPLSIRRDGQEIDMIAKFPGRPRQDR